MTVTKKFRYRYRYLFSALVLVPPKKNGKKLDQNLHNCLRSGQEGVTVSTRHPHFYNFPFTTTIIIIVAIITLTSQKVNNVDDYEESARLLAATTLRNQKYLSILIQLVGKNVSRNNQPTIQHFSKILTKNLKRKSEKSHVKMTTIM